MGVGGVAKIFRLVSMMWRLPWDRLIETFSRRRAISYFLGKPLDKRQRLTYKLVRACGLRAISLISMKFRNEILQWSTLATSQEHPELWRLER